MTRLTCLLLFGALALLTSSCSRPVGSVTGKVTYQGKVLKGGTVSFASTEGRQSFTASIDEDGGYTVPNLIGGSYKVCVETDSLKPPPSGGMGMGKGTGMGMGSKMGLGPGPASVPKGPKEKNEGPPADATIPEGYKVDRTAASGRIAENAKKYIQIPDKYSSADKTDMTFEFKGGSETHNIELK